MLLRRRANISSMSGAGSDCERIYYDGDCGVCHWAVTFVARHDQEGRSFRFAPLAGETMRATVDEARRQALPDSLVVQSSDGELLLRSSGLVHILRRLGGRWALLGSLIWCVPRPLRDWAYDLFAAIRHRLVSRPEGACPVVKPELGRRFDP